jgi:hypothetical protein
MAGHSPIGPPRSPSCRPCSTASSRSATTGGRTGLWSIERLRRPSTPACPKATPGDREDDSHDRVRRDRVDKAGKITLRYQGRLYSIGIGRTHARTRLIVLVQDLDIRVVDAATGELLRELVLDPSKNYQGTGRPPGPNR